MSYIRSDLDSKKPVKVDVPHSRVMMCLNESTLDPWQILKPQFIELMEKVNFNRYHSWITDALLNELSRYCGVDRDMIIMGNGADEMLYYLFTAVNDKNAFAVSLSPSYFDYLSYCNSVGLDIKMFDLDEDFSFSTDDFLKAANDPDCKLVILCNPNNPTGNLIPQKQIETIIENCSDKIVLIDETYYEFSGTTWADKLSKFPNLVLIRSFSKGFSSAGLRFGYMIASHNLAYQLKKVVTAFNYSIFLQAMVYTILKNKSLFLNHNSNVISERVALKNELEKIPRITVFPSSTNFLLFKLRNSVDLFEHLLKNDVAVRNVGNSAVLKNCLRVTVSSEGENKLFLKHVRDFIYEKV